MPVAATSRVALTSCVFFISVRLIAVDGALLQVVPFEGGGGLRAGD
jgi:hypothetical protein